MFSPFGSFALGTEPLGGDPLHDPPTVTVVPLGSVSTGGPALTVEWDYQQAQGDPQEWYRVLVLNDALDTVYYDSGWLESDAEQHVVDVDAEGVPHESDDLTVRVMVRGPESIGVGAVRRYQASDEDPFEIHWGVPHCTITDPADGAVFTEPSGLTVKWGFSDDDGGNTQGWFRCRLLLAGSGQVEHDSGWVPGTDSEYVFPVALRDGSRYRVEVQLKNNHGIRSD